MQTPEGRVKNKIREHLRSINAYTFSPVQMGLGVSTLDLLCCLSGRFLGVEVKKSGGKPTPRQLQVMQDIRGAGGIAFCCDSYETYIAHLELNRLIPRTGPRRL